jgi:dienelactone hydrolase
MNARCFLFFCLLYFAFAQITAAQNRKLENGAILEQAAYVFPVYAQLPDWAKRLYTPESYPQISDSPDVELVKIKYASDNLKITGFIYKPRKTDKKLPVVLWNRSGAGDVSATGNHNFHNVYEMYQLAKAGFVVLASQYRGTDGSEGADELGGGDTRDVMNLFPLAKRLPYADAENLFAFGASRGAMMTLQAIRDGLPIKAAVVVGTPTDWNEMIRLHPDVVPEAKRLWQDFDRRRDEHIRNRSALVWADKLDVPLLILNGSDDPATPPSMAIALAQKLAETGGIYELTIYARDDHLISNNREDRLRRTIEWFQNPPKKSIGQVLLKTFKTNGIDAAIKQYRDLKAASADSYDWRETELNQLGYVLLREGKAKEAVEIFRLNVEAYPNSFNVYDSFGEGLMSVGDLGGAIKNYKRSLALNPQNINAEQAIKKLEAETKKTN